MLSDLNIAQNFNLHMFINDFLMAIFFLVAGCEIKHEILHGNLSSIKKASFPVIAAIGGVTLPAIIFILFNFNTKYTNGIGVPISTDIAFAVGIFMIFRNKLNLNLKVFLLSLAVVDDLISILVIGIAYSSHVNLSGVVGAAVVMCILVSMNKILKVEKLAPYLAVGAVLWYFVYISGIHSTISGVLLAMVLPSKSFNGGKSTLTMVGEKLSPLCNYFILPLFAFSNTGINLGVSINYNELKNLMSGIVVALVIGKPLGIVMFTYIGTKLHITEKPEDASWSSILQVGMLAGIGFTMSIFVAELAFSYSSQVIDAAKISILIAAMISIGLTYATIVLSPIIEKRNLFMGNKN